ncbi:MAG TPA: DUF4252 domain-containing protein [Bryobacteraceae bacterium]|nr:DUF4252 domain-containing protein [Bryobacteraceae bacterium]
MRRFAILFLLAAASMPAQALKLEALDKLAAKATESVTVSLDSSLLQLASRFLSDDPDQAQVKKLVAGLKGVYVRNFEFAKPGQYAEADLDGIRAQLKDAKWKHIVEVRGKENADVCLRQESDKITGLAVVVTEALELTVIYIDGPIDMEGLSKLGGNFGIPEDIKLKLEKKNK